MAKVFISSKLLNVINKDVSWKCVYPIGKTMVLELADDCAGSAVVHSEKDQDSKGDLEDTVQSSEAVKATKESVVNDNGPREEGKHYTAIYWL